MVEADAATKGRGQNQSATRQRIGCKKTLGSRSKPGEAEAPFVFLDMGAYHFEAFPELFEALPGSPALQGLQIMQMLPGELASRAQYFARLSGAQVII